MLTIDRVLNKLQTSAFRAGFRLKEKDKAYVREKGMDTIRRHVQDFVRQRLAPAEVLDDFLTELAARQVQLFIVSGNHDSPERLDFGSRIMAKNGVHIAGTFDGFLKKITLQDEYGPVNIFLLPFIKPAMVQSHFADQNIESYEDAARAVIQAARINSGERNILVAHQFITSGAMQPERSDSETVAVGGLNNIDASVLEPFDYVALGHLHGPQSIGRETVRYSGSPLKYSFSEVRQQKSVTLIEFAQKGTLDIQTLNLTPQHDMREIKGPLAELIRAGASLDSVCQDYLRAILTDEDEVFDAIGQLRQVYPNIMRLDFENSRNRQATDSQTAASGDVARKSPLELFEEFYIKQNNGEMKAWQTEILALSAVPRSIRIRLSRRLMRQAKPIFKN